MAAKNTKYWPIFMKLNPRHTGIFGVADKESDVSFVKFKMADPYVNQGTSIYLQFFRSMFLL
ncbi:hypothetical protein DD599_27385 [Enterobacter cloacae complex sp. CH23B]|nr:hypothetical protein DD599_27385 [Enterobacter cloacae complex sp. CH23B]